MTELLASLIPWGTGAILWVQSLRHPFFDALFLAATFLGEEEFFLIFLPFIYWCLNKQVGVGLTYISVFSHYLNSVVKMAFGLPRPSDPRLALLRTETSPSFPSGHAQSAVVNWGYLVTRFHYKVFRIVAVVLILLIAFSRIYVGVHFPQDIVGGLLIGLLLLVAYNRVVGTIEKRRFDLPLPMKLTLSVVIPLALFVHASFRCGWDVPGRARGHNHGHDPGYEHRFRSGARTHPLQGGWPVVEAGAQVHPGHGFGRYLLPGAQDRVPSGSVPFRRHRPADGPLQPGWFLGGLPGPMALCRHLAGRARRDRRPPRPCDRRPLTSSDITVGVMSLKHSAPLTIRIKRPFPRVSHKAVPTAW